MDTTKDIIKSRFAELPPELQTAITAADLPGKFDAISKKFNLRIDQSGILQTETVLVMLGLETSGDFMNNLMENAEMSTELAKSIADEVNNQIFSNIRSYLREMESAQEKTENDDTSADLEKAGNLSVEKDIADKTDAETLNKADILNSIENTDTHPNLPINILTPVPAPQISVAPSATVTNAAPQPAPSSPLVNRLMSAPVTTTNEKVEKKMMPGPDPYREPIE
jgi:hypothetical protein